MVTWKIKSCPRCGGDMFLDTDRNAYFDHCLQCGYLEEKRIIREQEHRHDAGVVTVSGGMTSDGIRYEAERVKPGRPKGSKDKKKRRRKGEASYQGLPLVNKYNGGDSMYPR